MAVNIPNEYLITIGDESWMAEYVGSGAGYRERFGFPPDQSAEQYAVPEGVLMVSAGLRSCQLFSGGRDGVAALDSSDCHFYRMRRY